MIEKEQIINYLKKQRRNFPQMIIMVKILGNLKL